MKDKYDVIVIGSGIGGLTSAVLNAKLFKKRVLVLEQHFEIGGQTHEFHRTHDKTKYSWDVGVHYIGEMQSGRMSRKIFDYLTDGNVKWNKMPDPHDVFIYPDLKFPQASNPVKFKNDLLKMFPEEETGIKQYFKDLKKAASWYQKFVISEHLPLGNLLALNHRKLALTKTKDYLDLHFKDQKIKAILCSIWGDYGVPPSESAFVMHALVIRSYLHGGYYPVGGASAFAKAMAPIIEDNGGKIKINTKVNRIIIENGKAIGVEASVKDHNEKYYGEIIISDAGAYNTYMKLLSDNLNSKYNKFFDTSQLNISCNTLYLGLNESPEKLGIKGENYWIFTGFDHDEMVVNSKNTDDIQLAFISFPSMKNPESTSHTMEIITFTQYDKFTKWEGTKWKKRGEDYDKYKENVSNKLIEFAEKQIPGIKELIVYHELSTPLTMEYFTEWEKGGFYSFPATPEKYKNKVFKAKTPVKNLYLTGTDAGTLGVLGAIMGAIFSTVETYGFRYFIKIMNEVNHFYNKNKAK